MAGQVPCVDDYDAFVEYQCARRDLTYCPVPLDLTAVRDYVLAATHPHPIARFNLQERSPVAKLGATIARRWRYAWPGDVAVDMPRAAVVHRNHEFRYHHDVTNPYPCVNASVFFRHDCDGGHLVFPDTRVGVACADGWMLLFDGQRRHGVTPLSRGPDGYRIALTFYMPVLKS